MVVDCVWSEERTACKVFQEEEHVYEPRTPYFVAFIENRNYDSIRSVVCGQVIAESAWVQTIYMCGRWSYDCL